MARGGFNGFPGGGGRNNMMKQIEKLQKQMEEMQENLANEEISATSGGGAVCATVNGNKELISIKLDKDAVDPDDVEMLEDLIVAAVNEAMRNAESKMNSQMGKLTGGLNIPGL
ncbi:MULTISPECIES: YbaB/EbfC family nucleoid-associated protein [Peptoniphilus]|uniref:Nucleoid-associated protein PV361_03860 n=2 Tax=Peptoniphilus TaxID=162289 RepID=A0ABU7X9P4_9FIRM|nr:YbaB/EbfC family nucleoid-associated protein [Peptoniphilus grossensis]MDU5100235.1 YbaB/EbfC family nucleoid-associated protein [Peptoniphilus grossensis]MDU7151516.1 YbaB/EbfC family nucleoid-associated protein [Peptoniphilus grossensis]